MDGRTIFVCPILSRCSSVRRAADEAPISGQIGIGNYRDGARVAERWPHRLGYVGGLILFASRTSAAVRTGSSTICVSMKLQ